MTARGSTVVAGLAIGVAGLLVGADIFGHHEDHAVLPWHAWPGFDLVYGLAGCAAIVLVSKALGRRFLQRPESEEPGP